MSAHGHGVVLPGNSRSRNRSRSRARRAWKAPTRLQHLVEIFDERANDQRAIFEWGRDRFLPECRRFFYDRLIAGASGL